MLRQLNKGLYFSLLTVKVTVIWTQIKVAGSRYLPYGFYTESERSSFLLL